MTPSQQNPLAFEIPPSMTQADYEDVFRRIYDNRYFTNHGPLAREFEERLEQFLEIDHVVSVGNDSLALLIALAGLEISGPIIVPAFGSDLVIDVAAWLGLEIQRCDVEENSHQLSVESLRPALTPQTSAVVLLETWGNRGNPAVIQFLNEQGIQIVVVAFDSLGSRTIAQSVAAHPDAVTVYSFGPDKIVSTTQGGAIAVSNDDLAHRFRNIRSSYGVEQKVDVTATCNGRFSEFQAGVGIKNLTYLEGLLAHYSQINRAYRKLLSLQPNLSFYESPGSEFANGHRFPVFDQSNSSIEREKRVEKLEKLGYFQPKFRPISDQFPVAQRLSQRIIQLPVNHRLGSNSVIQIADQLK